MPWSQPATVLVTGIQAAGKSTVATLLAEIGLWLDTSAQTPDETVDEILARAWTEGRVP